VIGSHLPPEGQDARIVDEIVARIDSLTELVKDLLLFARPPQPRPAPTDIAPLVALTADLLGADPALGGVRVRVEGSAPPVPADPGLLRIVFLNLLVNSAQAMKGQGTIDVSVSASTAECVIRFSDNGPGIPPEVRDKVFTPFFTTKARGTGLGLSTAKRVVEAHGGTISVECPTAGGTTVTIALPFQADRSVVGA
jgi:signal transduction histidine kinase